MKHIFYPIAVLATGDELINGDILNTNGQKIAGLLLNAGLSAGMHLICPDSQKAIEQGLQFLLQHHDAVIITGGLGPTSDDKTRFAISEVTQLPLIFDEASWEQIKKRLNKYGLAIPENNKQQALFPEGATIYPNPNGTASGAFVTWQNKSIFMLPGPPAECIPLFTQHVLPNLISHFPKNKNKIYKWRLFGVSEGEMATRLDELVSPFHCNTGYRIDYPYLECKLYPYDDTPMEKVLPLIEKEVAPHQISSLEKTASELLVETIQQYPGQITINDQATQGRLQSTLLQPETAAHLSFTSKYIALAEKDVHVKIYGLTEYWEQRENMHFSELTLHLISGDQSQLTPIKIPLRGKRTLPYVVEILSFHIYQFLRYVLEEI